MNYIFIADCGSAYKASEITEQDGESVEAGILVIINPTTCKSLCSDGSWEPLDKWPPE